MSKKKEKEDTQKKVKCLRVLKNYLLWSEEKMGKKEDKKEDKKEMV